MDVLLEENGRRGLELFLGAKMRIGASTVIDIHGNVGEGIGLFNGGRLTMLAGGTMNISDSTGFAGLFLGGNSSFSLESGPTVNISSHPNGFGAYLDTNSTLALFSGATINVEGSGGPELAVFNDSVVLADFGGVINVVGTTSVIDSLVKGAINVTP